MLISAREEAEVAGEMHRASGSACPLAKESERSIFITRCSTKESVCCGTTVSSSGVGLIPSIGIDTAR